MAEEEEEEEEEEARAERRARATCLHAIVLRLVRRGTTDDILPVGILPSPLAMCFLGSLGTSLRIFQVFFQQAGVPIFSSKGGTPAPALLRAPASTDCCP